MVQVIVHTSQRNIQANVVGFLFVFFQISVDFSKQQTGVFREFFAAFFQNRLGACLVACFQFTIVDTFVHGGFIRALFQQNLVVFNGVGAAFSQLGRQAGNVQLVVVLLFLVQKTFLAAGFERFMALQCSFEGEESLFVFPGFVLGNTDVDHVPLYFAHTFDSIRFFIFFYCRQVIRFLIGQVGFQGIVVAGQRRFRIDHPFGHVALKDRIVDIAFGNPG